MREIKFRAWHKGKKEMWSPEMMARYQYTLMPDGSGFINVHGGSVKLSKLLPLLIPMQFTGLLDKNGREIYEGDIMVFDIKQVGVWPDQEKPHEVKYPFVCGNADLGEVIGNVTDNPELLGD